MTCAAGLVFCFGERVFGIKAYRLLGDEPMCFLSVPAASLRLARRPNRNVTSLVCGFKKGAI